MRKSVNITNSTKKLIQDIREVKYPNDRVWDSFIINQALKSFDTDEFQGIVDEETKGKKYQSIKYNFDIDANKILDKFMSDGYKADTVLKVALENLYSKVSEEKKSKEKFELYQKRYNLIFQKEGKINILGTSGKLINMKDFLPLIYSVSISGKSEPNETTLYVGKSKLFADRESTHIISLYDNPGYFGLEEADLSNENLCIRFSIEEVIDISKCNSMKDIEEELIQKEKEHINTLKPITQIGMVMMCEEEKRKKVREVINKILVNESNPKEKSCEQKLSACEETEK